MSAVRVSFCVCFPQVRGGRVSYVIKYVGGGVHICIFLLLFTVSAFEIVEMYTYYGTLIITKILNEKIELII